MNCVWELKPKLSNIDGTPYVCYYVTEKLNDVFKVVNFEFLNGNINIIMTEHYYSDTWLGSVSSLSEAKSIVEKRIEEMFKIYGF